MRWITLSPAVTLIRISIMWQHKLGQSKLPCKTLPLNPTQNNIPIPVAIFAMRVLSSWWSQDLIQNPEPCPCGFATISANAKWITTKSERSTVGSKGLIIRHSLFFNVHPQSPFHLIQWFNHHNYQLLTCNCSSINCSVSKFKRLVLTRTEK